MIGRLHRYFLTYFETFSAPTADTLFLFILSILALESAHSIRFLYQHFLSGITEKSLNVFYYACSYAKVDYSRFMNTTAKTALKINLLCIVKEYPNLDLIGNTRIDSVMYDLAPARTGHRGRPAKHGKQLSIETDFSFSSEKIGGYYTGVRRVLTKIFGSQEVLAYVTATEKEHGTKHLFFSTIFPEELQIFCAWQEKAPLNQTGSGRMKYIPLFLYSFRWNIETSYYEQKTF